MKKALSMLLAVLLLASLCVTALAADEVTVETAAVADAATQDLIANFGKYFAESDDLQALAGENGISIGDILNLLGDFDGPVTIELDVDDPALVSGLVRMVDGEVQTIPATYNQETGKVEITISEPGEYVVVNKVIDYRTVLRTIYEEVEETFMIDSVEYTELVMVPREVEDIEEYESTRFVVIPGDQSNILNKEDREAVEAATETVTDFEKEIVATNPVLANTAISNYFYTPEGQDGFTTIQIADGDIFKALVLVTPDGQIKLVDATIDENGNLIYDSSLAGTYFIFSEKA